MTECPKRNAVTNREAMDKLLDNRKRRSSAQVQQDKQMAAVTAATSEEKKTDLALQKKQRIAAWEDLLRKEDQERGKKIDLASKALQTVKDTSRLESEHKQPVLDPEILSAHDGLAEHDYPSSEGPLDIPGSVVGTESSEGHGLPFDDASEGDHEDDEDYLMESEDSDKESNLDSDGGFYVREDQDPPKKPGKVKSAKVCS